MSKKLPRKALIAVSSFNGAIYPGGHKTGDSEISFVESPTKTTYFSQRSF